MTAAMRIRRKPVMWPVRIFGLVTTRFGFVTTREDSYWKSKGCVRNSAARIYSLSLASEPHNRHSAPCVELLAEIRSSATNPKPTSLFVIPTNELHQERPGLKICEDLAHVSRRTVTPSNGTFI